MFMLLDMSNAREVENDVNTVAEKLPIELLPEDIFERKRDMFGVPPPKEFPMDLGEGQMRPTTSYATAPKSKIYDSDGGMWKKVDLDTSKPLPLARQEENEKLSEKASSSSSSTASCTTNKSSSDDVTAVLKFITALLLRGLLSFCV